MRCDIGEPCNLKPKAKYKDKLEQRFFSSRALEQGNDEKDPAVDSYSKRGPTPAPPTGENHLPAALHLSTHLHSNRQTWNLSQMALE